jgi:hypothetical protein
MKQQDSQPNSNRDREILEQGDIYFLYRPKVEYELVKDRDDVQHFYMVLSPHGKDICRLIIVGQKQLPSLESSSTKGWAFVKRVTAKPKELEQELRNKTYETKTQGTRHQSAARPVAEGVYDLVCHADDMRLVYAIELPQDLGVAQNQLNIQKEAVYIISIKNPEVASPSNTGLRNEQQADYPEHLQKAFGNRRFINAKSSDFLDYEGTELILISSQLSADQEPGLHQNAQSENEQTGDIFNSLRMRKSRHPIEAILTGNWI